MCGVYVCVCVVCVVYVYMCGMCTCVCGVCVCMCVWCMCVCMCGVCVGVCGVCADGNRLRASWIHFITFLPLLDGVLYIHIQLVAPFKSVFLSPYYVPATGMG